MSADRHPNDCMTHYCELGELGLLHTAKVCTKTVVYELCPPFERKRISRWPRPGTVAAFVRHPLDRLVSVWADCSRPHRIHLLNVHRMTGRPIEGLYAGMPFNQFARFVAAWPLLNRHWFPQRQWLRQAWGTDPDVLIRYERLLLDWDELRLRFAALPPFPVRRHNQSQRGGWQDYYSDELRELLSGAYRDDLRWLGLPDHG